MNPKQDVNTIIFDAGGVLIYINEFRNTVVNRVLLSLGYEQNKIDMALEEAKKVDKAYCSEIEKIASWEDEKKWLMKRYEVITAIVDQGNHELRDKLSFLAFDTFQYNLYDETLEVLERLNNQYDLAVLSNATASLDWSFDFLDIRKYFKEVVISSYEKCEKPNRKIYEIVLERMNKTASQCVFIDDKIENVEMANRVGIKGFHLDRKCGMDLYNFENMLEKL